MGVSTDNIIFDGSGITRTVTITPTVGLTGTAIITVTVDDGIDTAYGTFKLIVEPYRIYIPLILTVSP